MPVKKNYEAYERTQQAFQAFRAFVAINNWTIYSERDVEYGYQFYVMNGKVKLSVQFFPSGKSLIQGDESALKAKIQRWDQEYKSAVSASPLSLFPAEQSPVEPPEKVPATNISSTIQTGQMIMDSADSEAYRIRTGLGQFGKEEYFGPLVIGAVHMDAWVEAQFVLLGVERSTNMSDEQILALAEEIKKICTCVVVPINNKRYNELYKKMRSVDSILALCNARAIEQIAEKEECKLAISYSCGDEMLIKQTLEKKGLEIQLDQHERYRNDLAIRAASVLAQAKYIEWMA